jgi:hypothetical protein|tara:strand:+ start:566 stop:1132 length:567 start_codon:yes stop_codon:yes gene_type:complete
MGTIKTTNIEPIADNGTVTLGSSGDTFTFASGVTGINYPAFQAYKNATQDVSDATTTVVSFEVEKFDTNNAYDTSTYRFTPQVAGKYFIYAQVTGNPSGSQNIEKMSAFFFKNGTQESQARQESPDYDASEITVFHSVILDLNGSSDYVDVRGNQDVSSGTPRFAGDSGASASVGGLRTYFGAYRIGT